MKIVNQQFTQFISLMQTASRFYHANPRNPPKNMDISSQDVQTLLESLNRFQVKYLLVGGMAGMVHGHTRTTFDLDLWIRNDTENHQSLKSVLKENKVSGADFLPKQLVFGYTSVIFGENSLELDLGHELKSKLDFDECYTHSIEASYDEVPFRVIHLKDLIIEKRATGRLKDLMDLEELEKIQKRNS